MSELKTTVNDGVIEQCYTDNLNRTIKATLDTKEDAIRKALIELGWTPPNQRHEGELEQLCPIELQAIFNLHEDDCDRIVEICKRFGKPKEKQEIPAIKVNGNLVYKGKEYKEIQ